MREIKFRAFYKIVGKIYPVTKLSAGFYNAEIDVPLKKNLQPIHKTVIDLRDEAVLMQYTGTKDITDTEIYEKDILGNTEGHIYGIVEWDNDLFAWVIAVYLQDGKRICYFLHEIGDGEFDNETIQILGNIYENPELLGGTP